MSTPAFPCNTTNDTQSSITDPFGLELPPGSPRRADYVKAARVFAKAFGQHPDAPAYLPRTEEEAERFEPHAWVIAAMMQAYADGLCDAPALPQGFAMVPKRMTRAMRDVVDAEGWEWRDVLAAAEAITDEEYNAECDDMPTPPSAQQATGSGQVLTDAAARINEALLAEFPRQEIDLGDVRTILAAATQAQPASLTTSDSQFLTDVLTASGLVSHGGRDKALGARLGEAVTRIRSGHSAPTTGKREPLTPAERRRLWNNSPEHHADAKSIAGFERIVTLTERAHGITGEQR